MTTTTQSTPTTAGKLLISPREAAKTLSVCEKTLWTLTKRGQIPAARIGRAVRYDVQDLRAFCDKMKRASSDTPVAEEVF